MKSPNGEAFIVTMGDPSGIGPEITRKAWAARNDSQISPFAVIGDPEIYQDIDFPNQASVPVQPISDIHELTQVFSNALPVLPIKCADRPEAGKPAPSNAQSVIRSIERAVELALAGKAAGIVTNPISKAELYKAGFNHPGHTEFLAELAQNHTGRPAIPVMMLAAAELRVVPATVHIPLSEVPEALTTEHIIDIARITIASLQSDFGIREPRLAVTGLNPHAGENGAMGDEEARIISPAIKILIDEGLKVTGPHPADTIFHEKARSRYDAVIAMYHDQALIPIKTLAFDRGVNVTLGLPFIRTSPDHGTAFDIAGQNRASETSLVEALKLAQSFAQNRSSSTDEGTN